MTPCPASLVRRRLKPILALPSRTVFLSDSHQVYSDSVDVYDARLNQTEISGNKNKFYILQLLHPIGQPGSSQLFTRWGRVGEPGASLMKGPWPSTTAVNEFKKQFKAKTGTDWDLKKVAAAKKGNLSNNYAHELLT